ncbi:MAG: DUF4190 domain-containing protein [Verrucomicrobiae bacterium]|nr:DUF4190 domain-containing protein [Verrucomicrobiae bacterium]
MAVASMVLGMLGFLTILMLGIIPAIVALICGHVALIKIRHSHPPMRGRLAAYLGLFAGYTTILLTPLLAIAIAVAIPLVENVHHQSQERNRLDHASELYRACETFARDHNDRYPENWDQLRGRYLSSTDLDRVLAGQHASLWEDVKRTVTNLGSDGDSSTADSPAFLLVPHDRPVLRELEGSVIVIREVAPPDVERIVVAYDNGQTTMVANPDRQR